MTTSNLLRTSVAAVLLAASGSAFAVTLPGSLTAGEVLPVSGATATDRVLSDTLLDNTAGLCQDNAFTSADVTEVFTSASDFGGITTNNAGGTGTATVVTYANYAVACKFQAARIPTGVNGLNATTTYVVIKYSGGSGSGVNTVANGTALATSGSANWVDPIACKAARTPSDVTYGGLKIKLYTNCGTVASPGLIPKMGVTDVEAKYLGGTATAVSRLTARQGAGIAFAPAVSANFYQALQTAQGITGCGADPKLRANTTVACLPSLTSAQLRGLFTGQLTDVALWSDKDGNAFPAPGNADGDTTIYVCRRGNTSGTQVSFQTYFLNQGCSSNAQTFVAGHSSGGAAWVTNATNLNIPVFSGTGNNDVKACLDAHFDNGDYAIGTLSTENDYNDTDNRFRYVKVDGVAPSVENIVAGKYTFFTENVIQTPNGSSPNSVSATQASLSTALQNLFAKPSVVSKSLVPLPFGYGGLIAVPNSVDSAPTAPYSAATVAATPVNQQRAADGLLSATNNCAPRTIFPNNSGTPTAAVKTDATN